MFCNIHRVRGFTRDIRGYKHFIDHEINSIQNFLSEDTRDSYQMVDVNVYQENVFHTKMMLKDVELDNHMFADGSDLPEDERKHVTDQLRHEMQEIFYGRNIP